MSQPQPDLAATILALCQGAAGKTIDPAEAARAQAALTGGDDLAWRGWLQQVRGAAVRLALEGRLVICPWHGAMFDLKTGRAVCGPASHPLDVFTVRVEGGTATVE